MKKSPSKQSGFGIVEIIIICLAVAAIGAAGILAYNRLSKTGTTDLPVQSAENYFTIKEWGVRAPYPGTDTFKYVIGSTDPGSRTMLSLASKKLSVTYDCEGANAGYISRYKPTDSADDYYNNDSGKTIAQAAKDSESGLHKVGDYYYYYYPYLAACGTMQTKDDPNYPDNLAITTVDGRNVRKQAEYLVAHLQPIPD